MRGLIKTATATALLLFLLTGSASAQFSVSEFNVASTSNQAGAHPDLTVNLGFPTIPTGPVFSTPDGSVRNLSVQLPPGMVGDPRAVGQCSQIQFTQLECSPESQIGVAAIGLIPNTGPGGGGTIPVTVPAFNMQPRNEDVTAEIAFAFSTLVTIHLPFQVRSDSDYGLTAIDDGIARNFSVKYVKLTTWGVPGDESHDPLRLNMVNEPISPGPLPRKPFFTNPSHCGDGLSFTAEASSYEEPSVLRSAHATLPGITGCEEVGFEPSLKARPTTTNADSPSGLDFDLTMPQNDDPDGRATSPVRDATVSLPKGLVVNPSSANGLGACSPQQIGLKPSNGDPQPHFDLGVPSCPEASDLGTVEVVTPVFDDPLEGHVYLATPHDNPFGSLLALYLTIEGHGLHVKLAGQVSLDPSTGQLTTTFSENPQLPVEHLQLHLNPGALGPLRTPAECGTYSTSSVLTPWSAPQSGPPATPSDTYAIGKSASGGPCASPANSPSFEAGSTSPIAGANSPFVVNLRRPDGSQEFSSLTVKPPPGLLARLAGVPYCSDAALAAAAGRGGKDEQASSSCPSASQVGTVDVAAGAGPNPFNAPGKVYLAGPYNGAPLSLAVVTPAVAGPFDLGTVVVRNALFVDPETTEVKAVTDPIPSILQGIPLDIRSIQLRLDRPNFTINPTSCEPAAVSGTVLSLLGSSAPLQSRFQVGECANLGFAPKLKLGFKGSTKRLGNPAVRAVLTAPPGQANIASTTVVLPPGEFIDNAHINSPCTRVQFNANACPPKSILGTARAYTPLLDKPLEGPVYFRSNGGERELPDMVADLKGQIHVVLVGFIDSVTKKGSEKSRVRTQFLHVPDAPVSRFELSLLGGKRGLLENSVDLCRAGLAKAKLDLAAQNGRVRNYEQAIKTSCRGKKSRRGASHKHRRGH